MWFDMLDSILKLMEPFSDIDREEYGFACFQIG